MCKVRCNPFLKQHQRTSSSKVEGIWDVCDQNLPWNVGFVFRSYRSAKCRMVVNKNANGCPAEGGTITRRRWHDYPPEAARFNKITEFPPGAAGFGFTHSSNR